jgi:hypothetical protein
MSWRRMGKWMYRATFFLNLGTSWKWVVSFTPRPLYLSGKSFRYPLDRRLGGRQESAWTTWGRENPWLYRDSNSDPLVVQPVASRYAECAILSHVIWRIGRAVSQAVRRWLPIAAAGVCVWAACGICGGQSGTKADFLRVLRFPLPIIPPISPSR